jgi:trk system potassium uptake protein TrkA
MDIVICGAGKVGEVLSRDLSRENHGVVIIEKNEKRLNQVIELADVSGVVGSGSLLDIQRQAGVDLCDIFIAVTPDDETNIIAAITARKIGARHVIARVRNPEYSLQMDFLRESLGITMLINPDLEAAREIERMLTFPAALGVETFGHGRVVMVETEVHEDCPYLGKSLKEIGRQNGHILIAMVERGEQLFIPRGDYVPAVGDRMFVTGRPSEIREFCATDRDPERHPKTVLIIAGSRVTRYLLPRLSRNKMRAKVIEKDENIADQLAAEFPDVEVIAADGTDQAVLREERLPNYDAVVALTGIDEENMLISLYAAQEGVKKTITKVNRTSLLNVIHNAGLQAIVTPNALVADQIIRFIRSMENTDGSNVEAFFRLAPGRAEALQFKVAVDSPVCNEPLHSLPLKKGLLVLCMLRGADIIFPEGGDTILPGDDVIVVTTHPNFQDISDILEKK